VHASFLDLASWVGTNGKVHYKATFKANKLPFDSPPVCVIGLQHEHSVLW
jgi:hypothetical protein